jgi:hypothetical protein
MAMEHRSKRLEGPKSVSQAEGKFDLDVLLHPARAFAYPMDVVRDPHLTLNEKRAILASWASDACALEAAPELRINASGSVVWWDDIMDALRILDREADRCGKSLPHYKRVLAKKRGSLLGIRSRSRNRDDQGRLLN